MPEKTLHNLEVETGKLNSNSESKLKESALRTFFNCLEILSSVSEICDLTKLIF